VTTAVRIGVITHYNADIYELMYPASLRGDIEWYRRKAVESGGPVLELGAGTGRIAIAIAEAGICVTALDSSESMLEKLRGKASGSSQCDPGRSSRLPAESARSLTAGR
jgi:ubiquinone/menaquinone biosynthesis C-methylase UbiE